MSADWYADDRIVKAKKLYSCEACKFPIEPGEQHVYQRGKFEGDFFTRRLHRFCCDFWMKGDDDYLPDFDDTLFYWLESYLGWDEAHTCYKHAHQVRAEEWKSWKLWESLREGKS